MNPPPNKVGLKIINNARLIITHDNISLSPGVHFLSGYTFNFSQRICDLNAVWKTSSSSVNFDYCDPKT